MLFSFTRSIYSFLNHHALEIQFRSKLVKYYIKTKQKTIHEKIKYLCNIFRLWHLCYSGHLAPLDIFQGKGGMATCIFLGLI